MSVRWLEAPLLTTVRRRCAGAATHRRRTGWAPMGDRRVNPAV